MKNKNRFEVIDFPMGYDPNADFDVAVLDNSNGDVIWGIANLGYIGDISRNNESVWDEYSDEEMQPAVEFLKSLSPL